MTALSPKPTHNFFPLRFSMPPIATGEERHRLIEVEAYLRAERRNFAPGHEIEDWLAAESEVDSRLDYARRLAGMAAGRRESSSAR